MARESCNLDKDEAEILKPSSSSSTPSQPPASPTPLSSSPPQPSPMFVKSSQEFLPQRLAPATPETQSFDEAVETNRPAAVQCVKRCFGCQKRVGLTAFRCRCGHLFCPRHRYSDSHDCSFDYKAAGRAEISKNNPLIRAAKIIKI